MHGRIAVCIFNRQSEHGSCHGSYVMEVGFMCSKASMTALILSLEIEDMLYTVAMATSMEA